MKCCDYCIKKENCKKDIGFLLGGCNIDFVANTEEIYRRLDNLEGCEDNEIYATQIRELRNML